MKNRRFTRKFFCLKCRTYTEHSVAVYTERVTCLSCGDERKVAHREAEISPLPLYPVRSGGSEKRV